MTQYRVEVSIFEGSGLIWPKIPGRRGRPHQPFV